MGCKDAVLPEPLPINQFINCLTYKENTRKPYIDNQCLPRALALHLHAKGGPKEETSKMITLFLENFKGTSTASFQGVYMKDNPIVEDLVQKNIFLYDIDLVDGAMIEEVAGIVGKHFNTFQFLRYYSHIRYVTKFIALFEASRCPPCDLFINSAGNLERHLTICRKRVKHNFPKNVNQLRETLVDNFDSFGILCTHNQKLFNNMAIFDFESFYVEDENFKDTEATAWIGKHIPISVSILSNFIQECNFVHVPNPRDLVSAFIDALEKLAAESKAE